MSIFGKDYNGRKNLPIFHFLTRYFPKALVEVTRVCVAGNAQHNKELELFDINWAREKSTDQLNTALRHMMDHTISGPLDEEPPEVLAALGLEEGESTYHLAKAAWRILAALELQIEEDRAKKSLKELAANMKPFLGFPSAPTAQQHYYPAVLRGDPGASGHAWAGEGNYAGREKEPWRSCPKCGGIHNMSFASYVPGYFNSEPPPAPGNLILCGGAARQDD